MTLCPYCGTPLLKKLDIPAMSVQHRRIYDSVTAAGPNGITPKQLLKAMYDNRRPPPSGYGQLRREIYWINKIIATRKQRISGKFRGSYRLIATE